MAAVGRATVIVEPPMDADVNALNEALIRMQDLLANPTHDINHDLLNLIGAIRGYGEMLYEDLALLHPTLQASLPPLLSAVESRQTVTSSEGDPNVLTVSEAPGVILAVDDMPENRELISRLLSRAGHTVISAVSGEEALELLETRGVDVVLLDLMMPGIGGSEVLKRMKEHEDLRATPVIMISGRQDMDQIMPAFRQAQMTTYSSPLIPFCCKQEFLRVLSANAGTIVRKNIDIS